MRPLALAAFALLAMPLAATADSMRCGSKIVNETSRAAEILEKCGEPQQKDVRTEPIMAKNPAGYAYKVGEQVVERWRYQRSSRALPMVVTVVDGKVIKLERAE